MADYTTVAKVKSLIGKDSDTNITAKITTAIPWVTAIINNWTGRRFDSYAVANMKTQALDLYESKLFLYDDENSRHLLPILTITLCKEGGATLVADTDFYINKGAGYLEKNKATTWLVSGQGYWSPVLRDIEISGTFGYTTVPGDVEAAATELAAIIVLEKTKTYDTQEGVETALMTKMPEYVQNLLNGYRAVSI